MDAITRMVEIFSLEEIANTLSFNRAVDLAKTAMAPKPSEALRSLVMFIEENQNNPSIAPESLDGLVQLAATLAKVCMSQAGLQAND